MRVQFLKRLSQITQPGCFLAKSKGSRLWRSPLRLTELIRAEALVESPQQLEGAEECTKHVCQAVHRFSIFVTSIREPSLLLGSVTKTDNPP